MSDWQRSSVESLPEGERAAALKAKAKFLHDTACMLQDQLGHVPVFLGDEPLIAAKRAIDQACERTRRVCERVLYRRVSS